LEPEHDRGTDRAGEPGDSIELSLTEARNRLPELAETTVRDGGIVYLTRYGRRVAATVPADVAENHEHMENAYLSALADEAKPTLSHRCPPSSSSQSLAWHDLHVQWARKTLKQLEKLDRTAQKKIVLTVIKLAGNPARTG
jgi:antitoxin (DNA-binding transcriptional repressor) of toxin-antitoxin stability system